MPEAQNWLRDAATVCDVSMYKPCVNEQKHQNTSKTELIADVLAAVLTRKTASLNCHLLVTVPASGVRRNSIRPAVTTRLLQNELFERGICPMYNVSTTMVRRPWVRMIFMNRISSLQVVASHVRRQILEAAFGAEPLEPK
jgi:hypothetical protein